VGRFWFSKSLPAGVARYVYKLTDGLTAADPENDYILFFNSFKKPNLKRIEKILRRPNVSLASFRFPNKIFDRTTQFLSQPRIDQLIGNTVDVFISPHINSAALSRSTRHIQVIHDLSFALYPEMYPWNMRLWHAALNLKRQCVRADRIIAVSEATKQDLINKFGTDESKIDVIHEAAEARPKHSGVHDDSQNVEQLKLPQKYILYLGTLEPRKNVSTLIKAYEKLVKKDSHACGLVLAGSRGWKMRKLIGMINKSPARDKIHILGYIPESELPLLYAKAEMLVWPSYYEGFGLPPLEAQAHGTPVITSYTSSLPEILGSSAVYINPQDINDLHHAMSILISDSRLRAELVEKGLTQSQRFSWANCIEQVGRVVSSV